MTRGDKIMKICMFCSGKADLIEDIGFIKGMAEIIVKCPVCKNDFRMFMEEKKWELIKHREAIRQVGA